MKLRDLITLMGDLHRERDTLRIALFRSDLSEEQIEYIEDELADLKVHIEMTWDAIHKVHTGKDYDGY